MDIVDFQCVNDLTLLKMKTYICTRYYSYAYINIILHYNRTREYYTYQLKKLVIYISILQTSNK